ncbi:MAG: ABC transporter substrate-binding protein [Propionibacteriaceae bacterium]
MNRRNFLALTGLTGLTLATGLTGCNSPQSRPSQKAAVLGLTYIPNVQFCPAYVADQKSLWPTPVTLRHHGQQEGLFQALLSGQEDYVVAGADEAMIARSQGQELSVISSYYSRLPAEIITMAGANITSLDQLKGKKIGVAGKYGSSWFALLGALASVKLTEKDVTVVEIGYTSQTALATGKVDAVVGFANNDAVQMKLAKLDIAEIPLTTVPLVSVCLITTTKNLTTGGEPAARAVAAGLTAGIQTVRRDPAYALTATEKYLPTPFDEKTKAAAQATLTATIPYFTETGSLVTEQFDAMSTFLVENKLMAKPVPSAELVKSEI